jgi:carboxypeptidase Q
MPASKTVRIKKDAAGATFVQDSTFIRSLYDEALGNGESYALLTELTKGIGHRLSGSPAANEAMAWGALRLQDAGADTTWVQPVLVPSWTRGTTSSARAIRSNGTVRPLHITALGGSVSTPNAAPLRAQLVTTRHLDSLRALPREATEGRIVLFNRPMDPILISTGSAYGGAYDQRGNGAATAAEVGGVGALTRSLTHAYDTIPHTGGMHYVDSIKRVPAAAISTVDATWLAHALEADPNLEVEFTLDCEAFEDVEQGNVIGEWRGTQFPGEVIALGGHLDSWDIGEGAHDDGAGIAHTIEALRLLQANGYQPRRTLRFVLFINEENGNRGGKRYAAVADSIARAGGEVHIAALESDAGGFVPRGFRIDATDELTKRIRSFSGLLETYEIHQFRRGSSGVDIAPMKKNAHRPVLMGLSPDGQRYFDVHHSARDVLENVHPRELALGAATVASMIYLLDQHLPSPHQSEQ